MGREMVMPIPDINELTQRPILQTMASKDTWVKVDFFKKDAPTKAELYRLIEILCEIHNLWD